MEKIKNRLFKNGEFLWHQSPLLAGVACVGVSVLTLGVGLALILWAIPFTIWKAMVRIKLMLPSNKPSNVIDISNKKV